MFEHKKYILFITKTSLKLAVALEGSEEKVKVVSEHTWTNDSLSPAFSKIKQTAQKVKVVLDDELAYTVTIPTSSGKLDRAQVESKIKEFVPEDLHSTAWDYELYTIPNSSQKPHNYLQAVALRKSFFDPFIKAVEEVKLAIEAVEPVSSSLARMFSDSPEALILVTDKPLTLTCTYKEMVLGVKKTSQDKLAKEIDHIASHLSTEFKQPIKRIIVPPHLSSVPGLKSLEEKGYTIELKTVDPLVPSPSKNENTVIPEIIQPQILSDIKPPITPATSIPLESKANKPWMTIIIGAIIVLVVSLAGFFGYQKLGKAGGKPSPSPSATVIPSPSVSPSPSPLASVSSAELKKVKLSVLNGTSRKGEAKKVSDLLTKEGFNVAKTGNAVDDFKQTEIDAKDTVSKDILATLKKSLENYYTVTSGKTLDASASADIVVNIGLETKKPLP